MHAFDRQSILREIAHGANTNRSSTSSNSKNSARGTQFGQQDVHIDGSAEYLNRNRSPSRQSHREDLRNDDDAFSEDDDDIEFEFGANAGQPPVSSREKTQLSLERQRMFEEHRQHIKQRWPASQNEYGEGYDSDEELLSRPSLVGQYFDERQQWKDTFNEEQDRSRLGSQTDRPKRSGSNRLGVSLLTDFTPKEASRTATAEYRMHLHIMHNIQQQQEQNNAIQARRLETREKLKQKTLSRERLESSIGTPYLVRRLQSEGSQKSVRSMPTISTTKRSFTHPEYDNVFVNYVNKEKDRLMFHQAKREEELQKHAERKARRVLLEEHLRTPYTTFKHNSQIQREQAKQQSMFERSNRELSKQLQDLDEFDQALQLHQQQYSDD